MGQMTRAEIVEQGLAEAGRPDLTTLGNAWLNNWLRSQYKTWPWPFLNRRISGVALASGATSLLFGAGSGGVTPEVQKVYDPIFVYTSDYSTRTRARIRTLRDGSAETDESANDPTTNTGLPTLFRVRAYSSTWGKWTLVPWPVPDKDYLLAIDYLEQPANLASDSEVPLYPEDATMVMAVHVECLKYMKQLKEWQVLSSELSGRAVSDRVKSGDVPGTNDSVGLDSSVFRKW